MDCKNPDGCPTPLDCSGDGLCEAEAESFDCCSATLANQESLVATTRIFGEPLELRLNRLEAQIFELEAKLNID